MNCDSFIKAKIEKNCAEPIARGVERTAWIGNRAQLDIANLEFVEGSTNQVLNLPLLIVPDNSPAVCENIIDPLLDGEFFVIWQNRHKNLRATNEAERGASAYQIAGLFNGLTLSAGSCEKYSDDTLSGWAITLKEEKAPRSAMFLNAGSLAATEALIKTMLTPSDAE